MKQKYYYNEFWKFKKEHEKFIIKGKSYYVTFCCGKNSVLRDWKSMKNHFENKHLIKRS